MQSIFLFSRRTRQFSIILIDLVKMSFCPDFYSSIWIGVGCSSWKVQTQSSLVGIWWFRLSVLGGISWWIWLALVSNSRYWSVFQGGGSTFIKITIFFLILEFDIHLTIMIGIYGNWRNGWLHHQLNINCAWLTLLFISAIYCWLWF